MKKNLIFVIIVSLIGLLMMNGCNNSLKPTGSLNGHEYVDLGLPSGTKWATCNIGASNPEDCGSYFAWGETKTKTRYSKDNYRYWNNIRGGYTKYCCESRNNGNFVDNLAMLEASDDAATANWGVNWRMPTIEDFLELAHECTCTLTKISGKEGCIFTGPNGKSIFLPFTGIHYGNDYIEDLNGAGAYGNYWSSCLDVENVRDAWSFRFDINHWEMTESDSERIMGSVVRPVSSDNGSSKTSSVKETKTKDSCNGHDYVDLGLPSGTKWATCNVGASKPEEYGNYYAWGETSTKSEYGESNYTYSDNPTILPPSADAATANWGSGWRMPTSEEMGELYNNCTHEGTTQNGVNGIKFTGPNGNSIFLPAAGLRQDGSLDGAWECYYWTSSGDSYFACGLGFWADDYPINFLGLRKLGLSVRPVCK